MAVTVAWLGPRARSLPKTPAAILKDLPRPAHATVIAIQFLAVVQDHRHTERRQRHRRVADQRRRDERRGSPPTFLESLGYLLARRPVE